MREERLSWTNGLLLPTSEELLGVVSNAHAEFYSSPLFIKIIKLDVTMQTQKSRTCNASKPECRAKESGMTNVIEIQRDKKHLPALGGDPQRNPAGGKMLDAKCLLSKQINYDKGGG